MATLAYNPHSALPRMMTYTPHVGHRGPQQAINSPAWGEWPRGGSPSLPSAQGRFAAIAQRAGQQVAGQQVGAVNEVLTRQGPLAAMRGRQQQNKALSKSRPTPQGGVGSGPAQPEMTSLNSPLAIANRGVKGWNYQPPGGPSGSPFPTRPDVPMGPQPINPNQSVVDFVDNRMAATLKSNRMGSNVNEVMSSNPSYVNPLKRNRP